MDFTFFRAAPCPAKSWWLPAGALQRKRGRRRKWPSSNPPSWCLRNWTLDFVWPATLRVIIRRKAEVSNEWRGAACGGDAPDTALARGCPSSSAPAGTVFGLRWQSGAATALLGGRGRMNNLIRCVRAKAAWRCASRRSPRRTLHLVTAGLRHTRAPERAEVESIPRSGGITKTNGAGKFIDSRRGRGFLNLGA